MLLRSIAPAVTVSILHSTKKPRNGTLGVDMHPLSSLVRQKVRIFTVRTQLALAHSSSPRFGPITALESHTYIGLCGNYHMLLWFLSGSADVLFGIVLGQEI